MNKTAFFKLSYGLCIITAGRGDGKHNGQIANTVFQVTSEPATIAVSINKLNYTHECIAESKCFAVSILEEAAPMTLIGQFGFKCGRDFNKFNGIAVRTGQTGVPIVTDHACAFIEAKVINAFDCGTHTIFLGKVLECDLLAGGEPMTYAYYHQIKGGTAPKTAPTYQAETPKPGAPAAAKAVRYRCLLCAYLYDPEGPDSKHPHTPFEDLPETWNCPVCGAPKKQFEKEP